MQRLARLDREIVDFVEDRSGIEFLTLGLDQAGTPLFLLDRDRTVRHANTAALAMLDQSSVLAVGQGLLRTRRRAEGAALRDAVESIARDAATWSGPEDLILTLRDRQERVVMSLALRPFPLPGLPDCVLLRVADLLTPPASNPTILARMFGLTRAEARVAGGLLDGLDLEGIAARDGVALETARGHLKRAMGKLGVRSQARFVRMLARGYGALVVPGLPNITNE